MQLLKVAETKWTTFRLNLWVKWRNLWVDITFIRQPSQIRNYIANDIRVIFSKLKTVKKYGLSPRQGLTKQASVFKTAAKKGMSNSDWINSERRHLPIVISWFISYWCNSTFKSGRVQGAEKRFGFNLVVFIFLIRNVYLHLFGINTIHHIVLILQ